MRGPGSATGALTSACAPPQGATTSMMTSVAVSLAQVWANVEFVENPARDRLVQWMESMVYDTGILTDEFVELR